MNLQEYLQQHYTPSTAKAYLYEISNYTANYPGAAHAVHQDVAQYIGRLRSRYSNASTLSRIVSGIKAWYDFLCYTGERSDNPARSIRLRDQRSRDIQLQDLFTTEELESLLKRKERFNHLEPRNRVLMSLLIYQALQPWEMEGLSVQDVNCNTGSIYIRSGARTNPRELQLRPSQVLLFYQYIQEVREKLLQGNASGALLIGLRGGPMKAGDIIKHVHRSFKGHYTGREVTAQKIRQSVIANLLKGGHDLSVVQGFAGHKYPSSTERYRQGSVDDLKAAVNRYHPFS